MDGNGGEPADSVFNLARGLQVMPGAEAAGFINGFEIGEGDGLVEAGAAFGQGDVTQLKQGHQAEEIWHAGNGAGVGGAAHLAHELLGGGLGGALVGEAGTEPAAGVVVLLAVGEWGELAEVGVIRDFDLLADDLRYRA